MVALFTENFDYADIRRDFVRGILESDILSSKIFVHIAENGYAARVDSIRTYGAVRLVWRTALPAFGASEHRPILSLRFLSQPRHHDALELSACARLQL